MTTLRIGMVGCGLIAGGPVREGRPILGNHAAASREVPGVRLVAATDSDPARLAAFGRYWEVPGLYPSTEAMLAGEALDIVVVAAPPEVHESACMAAIESGARGILCEKPFTGSATGAARIADACKASGCKLVVNFTRRWDASHRALQERIARGDLGDVREVFASYTGTMRGNGTHFIDTLAMLVPGPWSVTWTSELDEADSLRDDGAIEALLSLEANGSKGRAFVAPIRNAEYFVFEIHILGTKGRARLMFQGNDLRIDLPAAHAGFPGYRYLEEAERLPSMTIAGAFSNGLAELVDAIREQREPTVSADAYVASLSLVDSIVSKSKKAEKQR